MKKFVMIQMAISALLYAAEGPKMNTNEEAWSDDFSGGKLSSRWMASNGGLGFSPKHVDLSKGMLSLRLTQTKNEKGEFTSLGAEVQTRKVYGFGTYTWEMRASSTAETPTGEGVGLSGSSSGVFNFVDDSAVEIDFEIEGSRSHLVWAVNWYKPKWDVKGVRVQADKEFHTYKYVWTSEKIEYFIDNKLVWTVTDHVPQKPAFIIMNHWGTKSTKWGGLPSEGTRHMWVRKFSFVPKL
jgi:endo-1,3-1,4-beta-glycanase ExoK